MENVLALLSAAAPLAILYGLYVLAQISQRFGVVTQRPPYYRAFYVAMAILLVPAAIRLLAPGLGENSEGQVGGDSTEALIYGGAFVIGLGIAIATAWQYWGWLIHAPEEHAAPGVKVAQHQK